MNAEIVLTGTELLLGEIVDTNSTMIARMLREIGLNLHYKTTVGDNETRITEVLRHALNRVDFVIVSGGLGPTVDDMTRQAAAAATDRELVYSEELEAQIAARFARFGRQMGENNKRQAWIPAGAIPVENPVGTAPCFIVETEKGSVICLPGVPGELQYQMTHAIIPYLQARMGETQFIKARVLRICGMGESNIDKEIDDLMRLSNPTVGLAAHLGQVDVRITAKAATEADADALIAPVEAEIRLRLGDVIFGVDKETLPELLCERLRATGLSIALVDTVTEGLVSRALQNVGCGQAIASEQRFDDPALAPAHFHLSAEPDYRAAAGQIAALISAEKTIGVSVIGPVETAIARNAILVALSYQGRTQVEQFMFAYDYKTGQQWITPQILNLIFRLAER